jgi:ribosome modulation factor
MDNKTDRRSQNNAHTAVRESGADAARRREPVHSCPYSHPAMRSSWLHGYATAQQMTLIFDLESPDA